VPSLGSRLLGAKELQIRHSRLAVLENGAVKM